MLRSFALSGCIALLSACKAGPEIDASPIPRVKPAFSARQLMDVCWPTWGPSPQHVVLTFIQDGATLKDVTFEAADGAPNSVGRCLREIAWTYPWGEGAAPEKLDVRPPATRPSGWAELAYIRLLTEPLYPPTRGVLDAAPLIRACIERGTSRPQLRYRVQTNPVRVTTFIDVSATSAPELRSTEGSAAVTDAERCVVAVLASTVYPGTRSFEFEFSDLAEAPPAAPADDVAPYFAPEGVTEADGKIESAGIQAAMSSRRKAVSACWEAALSRRSGLSGARRVRLRIAGTGNVEFAQIVSTMGAGDEAVDYLLDRCLVGSVLDLHVDPPSGGTAEVGYTWNFLRRPPLQ